MIVMTKLTELARRLRRRIDELERGGDAVYFEICPVCGEPFDARIRAEVLYHSVSDFHERRHAWH